MRERCQWENIWRQLEKQSLAGKISSVGRLLWRNQLLNAWMSIKVCVSSMRQTSLSIKWSYAKRFGKWWLQNMLQKTTLDQSIKQSRRNMWTDISKEEYKTYKVSYAWQISRNCQDGLQPHKRKSKQLKASRLVKAEWRSAVNSGKRGTVFVTRTLNKVDSAMSARRVTLLPKQLLSL